MVMMAIDVIYGGDVRCTHLDGGKGPDTVYGGAGTDKIAGGFRQRLRQRIGRSAGI